MESISFQRPDGAICPGLLANSNAGANAPGVVLLPEWWGLREQIKGVATRLAAEGFRVVLPDLYRGKVAADATEAESLSTTLNTLDAVDQDVAGALGLLKSFGKRCGVMGYCMGGALGVLAASRLPQVDATVSFYGLPDRPPVNAATLRAPFQGHFASRDRWITPARVDQLEKELNQTTTRFELYRYEADHAFCNETRDQVYNAAHATTAWNRTVGFLWTWLQDVEA